MWWSVGSGCGGEVEDGCGVGDRLSFHGVVPGLPVVAGEGFAECGDDGFERGGGAGVRSAVQVGVDRIGGVHGRGDGVGGDGVDLESGVGGVADEGVGVERGHGAGCGCGLGCCGGDGLDLGVGDTVEFGVVVAAVVEGFEHGEPSAGFEDACGFLDRPGEIFEVDQDAAGDDGVCGGVGDRELRRVRDDTAESPPTRGRADAAQCRPGLVDGGDGAVGADAGEGGKREQSCSGSQVDDMVCRDDAGSVEDTVTDLVEAVFGGAPFGGAGAGEPFRVQPGRGRVPGGRGQSATARVSW